MSFAWKQHHSRFFLRFVASIGVITTLLATNVIAQAQILPPAGQIELPPVIQQGGDAPTGTLEDVEKADAVDGALDTEVAQTSLPYAPQNEAAMQKRAFIPLAHRAPGSQTAPPTPAPKPAPADPNDVPAHINHLRAMATVPPVTFNATLNQNCWFHARYMAEENVISHDENQNSKWYAPGGRSCAQNGNVWLGGEYTEPYWEPGDSVKGWAESVGHRMWLLYPTTPVFGFGWYTASNNRAGAALDVLTQLSTNKDSTYANWPVRFPGPNQTGVPATAYVITLGWSYFGGSPTVGSVSLTANGAVIPHSVTTTLPVGHKGIQITPSQKLPANTTISVSVSGSYNGKAFTHAWSFTTGN